MNNYIKKVLKDFQKTLDINRVKMVLEELDGLISQNAIYLKNIINLF